MELFQDIAYAAVTLLIAVLAIYFAVRLLGKLAKFVITLIVLVVVAVVLWMIFSNTGTLPSVWSIAAPMTVYGAV